MDIFVDITLWAMLLAMAAAVVWKRDYVIAAICFSIYSLVTAVLFFTLDAPDVAITESAIGAAISFLFFLATFRVVGDTEQGKRRNLWAGAIICILLCLTMFTVIGAMPPVGMADSAANAYLGRYYIDNSISDTGVPNAVTSVLASYRGYDTLGEIYVILCGAIAVMLILPRRRAA